MRILDAHFRHDAVAYVATRAFDRQYQTSETFIVRQSLDFVLSFVDILLKTKWIIAVAWKGAQLMPKLFF